MMSLFTEGILSIKGFDIFAMSHMSTKDIMTCT